MYQLQNIKFSRGGFKLEIDHLTLKKGCIYSVVGPNGSGKSTFLGILGQLIKPDTGDIIIDGRRLGQSGTASPLESRRQISCLMQNPYLFNMTAGENAALGLRVRGIRKAEAEKKASVMMNMLNIGHLFDRPSDMLSGGEVQKTALARALVQDSQVLLLDEPTGNIDQKDVPLIEDVIRSWDSAGEKIIVFSSHSREQSYRLSNHIIPIVDGRILNVAYENIFKGYLKRERDESRTVTLNDETVIHAATGSNGKVTIAVDPDDIIVSIKPFRSSALNTFRGSITRVESINGSIRISVDCGVEFRVVLTARSFHEIGLNIGTSVWLTFKASAVKIISCSPAVH